MTLLTNAWRALTALAVGSTVSLSALAGPFRVSIDTTPLQSRPGFMAFDLVAGSPATGNAATISAFSTDAQLSSSTTTGNTSGSLTPGPLTLGTSAFFNEWLQSVARFGGVLSFDLNLGDATAANGVPDQFSFFLLDANQLPFATSDPSGAGALFAIDLSGASTEPAVYTSAFARVSIVPIGSDVPEPGTLSLVMLALATAAWPSVAGIQRLKSVAPATSA